MLNEKPSAYNPYLTIVGKLTASLYTNLFTAAAKWKPHARYRRCQQIFLLY